MALDHIDVSVDRIYAVFGESAVFAARDEDPIDCAVLVDANFSQYGDVARVTGKTVMVAVRTAEVPDVPRTGDTVSITSGPFAGRVLRVDSVMSSDAHEHRVIAG
jgi:predicted PP-loop superfamily ATPase